MWGKCRHDGDWCCQDGDWDVGGVVKMVIAMYGELEVGCSHDGDWDLSRDCCKRRKRRERDSCNLKFLFLDPILVQKRSVVPHWGESESFVRPGFGRGG